jgi:hypothetical protein
VKWATIAVVAACVVLILLAYASGTVALLLLAVVVLVCATAGTYFGAQIWTHTDDFDTQFECNTVFSNVSQKYLNLAGCGDALYYDRQTTLYGLDCPDSDLIVETAEAPIIYSCINPVCCQLLGD